MKQPELGKKIVELRKAKGYTQEELVEICNLNVRTLQRIETGVVTPRIYTIKTIFEALEYDTYESLEDLLDNNKKIADIFKTFFKHILDLFNFKKNTINKALVLIILLLLVPIFSPQIFSLTKEEVVATVQKQIENRNNDLTKWYASDKLDSIKATYLDSTNFIIDNGFPHLPDVLPSIKKPEGVISFYRFFKLSGIKTIEKKSKKMVVDNDIVVDLGILLFKGEIDEENGERRGSYICQWRKKNDKWQIETEMFNLK